LPGAGRRQARPGGRLANRAARRAVGKAALTVRNLGCAASQGAARRVGDFIGWALPTGCATGVFWCARLRAATIVSILATAVDAVWPKRITAPGDLGLLTDRSAR